MSSLPESNEGISKKESTVAIDKRGRIAIGSRFQIGGQDVRHQNEFVGQCTSFIDE